MDNSKIRVTICPTSLKLLADFWSLRIIESLQQGEQRYCELQRGVGNVNPATLTKKLADLEAANIIVRSEEIGSHSVHYKLSPLGLNAIPVLEAIKSFSQKYQKTNKK